LEAKQSETSLKLETLNAEYKSAIEQRTVCEKELKTVSGDAEVAELVERKSTIELAMVDIALKHLKISAGHRLAQEAIRRYRDKHRSGMMQSTESAFMELTNGAYPILQAKTDGTSEALIAVSKEGVSRKAKDMSKGTRFQLYLALRSAAYEQLVAQGRCLPFICDDIFETFDEDRTRSACKVMSRIGQTGQAIYLTHHRHVVDIATEVCGTGVRVHHI